MSDLITFVTSEALKPLVKKLIEIRRKRRTEIDTIDAMRLHLEQSEFELENRSVQASLQDEISCRKLALSSHIFE